MMLGIVDPDAGTSRLLGNHKPQSVRNRVGYLPEERGLYPGMKAREAIAFMGALRGLDWAEGRRRAAIRSEEHTSELQSLMRISYAVFCLKKKKNIYTKDEHTTNAR